MKKIRVMLTALVVLASVGGALAFKATKNESLKCGNSTTSCTVAETALYKITDEASAHFESTFCTISTGSTSNCTFVTLQ